MRLIGFVLALAIGTLAPFAAEAQSGKVPRLGVVGVTSAPGSPALSAFRQGLRELGYVGKALGLTIPQSLLLRVDQVIK